MANQNDWHVNGLTDITHLVKEKQLMHLKNLLQIVNQFTVASPSSTIHHLPNQETVAATSVVQMTRPVTIASKTSVSSTTGRNGKDGHAQRRTMNNSTEILSRSSPSGSIQQPDTTGVE